MNFTLNDFAATAMQLLKSGNPGMALHEVLPDGNTVEVDAKPEFRRVLAIIRSMTNEEREFPDQIHPNRVRRIARGSGTDPKDVDDFVRQFLGIRHSLSQLRKGLTGRPFRSSARSGH